METAVILNWIFRGACALVALACFSLLALYIWAKLKTPKADRDWRVDLETLAQVETVSEGQFTLKDMRDWRYDSGGTTSEDYENYEFDIDDVAEIWFVIEPLPGSTRFAHTILIFEMTSGDFIGLSIEARREKGETYSPFWGLWNTYELAYVWASAEDLLTRRAVYIGHQLRLYKVAVTEEQKRKLLVELARTTQELSDSPRFYNTLFNNCTNEFAQAVGLPWGVAHVMTGRADKYLERKGLLDRSWVKDGQDIAPMIIRMHQAGDDFDAAFTAYLSGDTP